MDPVKAFVLAIQDLKERIKEGLKCQFIIVDTGSSFEKNIILPYATTLFNQSLIGKGMIKKGNKVTEVVSQLASGGGYIWLFRAYEKLSNAFNGLFENCVIWNLHIKQASKLKGTEELSADDIYMTGKLGKDLIQTCQAVAQLYRTEENKVFLSFAHNERRLVTKASSPHLFNKEILISEMDENGEFKFYWENVFKTWITESK